MNDHPKQDQEELRQLLMEMHYGLLEQDESDAIRQRIETEPEVARMWADTLVVAGKLAEAAKVTAAANELFKPAETEMEADAAPSRPPITQPSGTQPSVTPSAATPAAVRPKRGARFIRVWVTSLAAAASIAIAFPAVRYFTEAPAQPVRPLQVAVKPTGGADAAARNEFLVMVRAPSENSTPGTFDVSAPIVPATISFQVLSQGIVLFRGVTESLSSESVRIRIPDDVAIPSNATLMVSANAKETDQRDAIRITVPLEPTRCLTYLSTDRPVYRPGETVFFRSVTLNRRTLAAHVEVPVRYELLDASGSSVDGAASEGVTERGTGNGAFVIPESAAGGSYTLVAKSLDGFFPDQTCSLEVRRYRAVRLKTKLEFGKRAFGANEIVKADLTVRRADDSIAAGAIVHLAATVDGKTVHQKDGSLDEDGSLSVKFKLPAVIREGEGTLTISINDGSVVETAARPIPIHTGRAEVDFYPEGGYLVGGIENRVYFAARDVHGEPIEVEGEILSQSGRAVATVGTVRDGLGKFTFKPESGQRYSLRITSPIDITETPWLPSVVEALPVLDTGTGVFEAEEPLKMTIRSTKRRKAMVRAVCRGELVGVQLIELGIGETAVEMPIQNRARGVIRVTVLDAETKAEIAKPLVERLVYRRGEKALTISATVDDESKGDLGGDLGSDLMQHAPGESIRMTLKVTDEHGQPVAGAALGVAVVDDTALSLRQKEQPSIATHFLLTSEVESPEDLEHANFYLSEGEEAAESLDLLLGTQGWRRFVSGADSQSKQTLRDSLVRLLELDGDRAGLFGNLRHNQPDFAERMRSYTVQVSNLWNRFLGEIRFALLVIGLVWFVAFLFRPRKELVVGATLLLTGVVLLNQTGCGASSESYPRSAAVSMEDSAESADQMMLEKSGALPSDEAIAAPGPPRSAESPGEERSEKDSFAKQVVDAFMTGRGKQVKLDSTLSNLSKDELMRWSQSRGVDAQTLADELMEKLRFPIRQYAHSHRPSDDQVRRDFAETLYWNPMMVTDSSGTATIRFDLSDSLTLFRVNIDGHSRDGRLGTGTGSVVTQQPLQVEPKLPLEVTRGDRIDLPVGLVNASGTAGAVELTLDADSAFKVARTSAMVSVDAGGRATETFSLTVRKNAEAAQSSIRLTATMGAEGLSDQVERSIRIQPSGFPFRESVAGTLEQSTSVNFSLPGQTVPGQTVPGSLRGKLQLFPSTQSQLSAGMESILREPHGCFEQTSASNYPNVLAFQLMTRDGVVDQSTKRRTESLLRRGYRKLAQYECKSGGFEWFGNDPGHEALTAFGLMQFAEMSHFINVEKPMMIRSRDWLLKRRDGTGGFHRNPRHLHSWAVSQDTVNAYVLWTLSEADKAFGGKWGLASELQLEIDTMQQVATESDDNYLIALSACALANLERGEVAHSMLDRLVQQQNSDGHLNGRRTVTESGGISRTVETTALAVLAWSTSDEHQTQAKRAVDWLMKNRRGGGFGSTQASVLALKALVAMQDALSSSDGGSISVIANGETIDQIKWTDSPREGVTWPIPPSLLKKGSGVFSGDWITLKSADGASVPFAVELTGQTLSPRSDATCPTTLSVDFAEEAQVTAGETIDVLAELTNQTDQGQPMTLAVIGLPGGVEPVIESLDKLRDRGEVDYYELRGREIVLYWRTIAPNEVKQFRLPVIAAVPGRYTAPPSRTYLYYTAEAKCWTDPLLIQIGQ